MDMVGQVGQVILHLCSEPDILWRYQRFWARSHGSNSHVETRYEVVYQLGAKKRKWDTGRVYFFKQV